MSYWKASTLLLIGLFSLVFLATPAQATLTLNYQFNGKGNWSIDAVGSNSTPVGTVSAVVPVGSTVEAAFLYSSMYSSEGSPTVNFDGTVYTPAQFTPLGMTGGGLRLQAFRADVTSQVAAKIGGGSGAPVDFTVVSETPNFNIDGEVLAIVYSNPSETDRTIAFLDGFSATTGDSAFVALDDPLDTSIPGFEALLSLGIGFGFQGAAQYSQVDINGRRLTTSAGGQDEGGGFNGGLITSGGLGDDPTNPANPFATANGNPRFDDELYNLALGNGVNADPFLASGITSITINTLNPSNDDNIFFMGFNITAEAQVNPMPEPGSLALMGIGLVGAYFARRKRR